MLIFLLMSKAVSFELPSFYHTSDELESSLSSLDCPNLKSISSSPMLQYKYTAPTSEFKTYMIFGEHSRELISPELALAFIEYLCESEQDLSNFMFIVNTNSVSRRKVEEGDWCLRTNENGVDLNRNWDAFWEASDCDLDPDTCSGSSPFSEDETKTLRDLLLDYKPDLFLSIHSGTNAMIMPYSHIDEVIEDERFQGFLEEIAKEYCNDCIVGTTNKAVNYKAYGTGIDYSFEYAKTPDSAVFEIYKEETSILSFAKDPHDLQFLGINGEACFRFFNPNTQDLYEETIERWINIIVDLISNLQEN